MSIGMNRKRVVATIDIAIERLLADSEILEGAGYQDVAEDCHACAVLLRITKDRLPCLPCPE